MALVVKNQAKLHRWLVWFLARRLAKQLRLKKYIISGSYRRKSWWCNDIDLIVPMSDFTEGEGIKALIEKQGWNMKARKGLSDNVFRSQYHKKTSLGVIVLDLFLATPGIMGNALLFTTGPKEHNDEIREEIIKKGYTWENPRYFTHIRTNQSISFANERSACDFLNLKWVKPSKRKNAIWKS